MLCCMSGRSIPFGGTVHHHDKVDEFPLAFLEVGTQSQGILRIFNRPGVAGAVLQSPP